MLKTSQEIVHEGWLIKSPPTKLWRAVSKLYSIIIHRNYFVFTLFTFDEVSECYLEFCLLHLCE